MKVYVLDEMPVACAKYHSDKHLNKCIIDYYVILSCAHQNSWTRLFVYKWQEHYRSNPWVQWVMKSNANYEWLLCVTETLVSEYHKRFKKKHKFNKKVFIKKYTNRKTFILGSTKLSGLRSAQFKFVYSKWIIPKIFRLNPVKYTTQNITSFFPKQTSAIQDFIGDERQRYLINKKIPKSWNGKSMPPWNGHKRLSTIVQKEIDNEQK